jgi:long-chain acyl-CoA synthetase
VTLSELLAERVRASPNGEAYRQFDAARGEWAGYSWAEVGRRVAQWRAALRAEGLPGGGRVAVLVPNSLEHVCVDQATLAEGLVPVPLHVIDSPESLAYVLADCGAAFLCIDSAERWSALSGFASRLPQLRRVVCLSGVPTGGLAHSAPEWLAAASAAGSGSEATPAQDESALAAIVYTSGTTGRPKGVMLTHRNVLANVRALLTVLPVSEADTFLSFLPLSHTLERTCGYYLPMAAGATVAFARSIPALMDDLQTIRPTVLVSVPRIYERAYTALLEQVGRRALTRAALSLAVRLGWEHFERAQRNPAAARPTFLERLLDARVAAPLRARFGGRVRAAVTGGAAIPEPVARTFLALGLPLLQGYGMTESAPVVSCNVPEDNDPSSVGRALPGVEVRLGERDELLVRGPNVMPGYWQRPEETAQALDPDGWLRTGDQARFRDGRIYISGRIKDIIVTSTGEKIAPADIEAAIEVDPVFEQALVIGEGRSYLAALVVLNRSAWAREAARLGLDPEDSASLRSPRALEWALERIAAAVCSWPRYAHPRVAWMTLEPWTIGAGLLTPTLKLKRNALTTRFAGEIAELYRGHTL